MDFFNSTTRPDFNIAPSDDKQHGGGSNPFDVSIPLKGIKNPYLQIDRSIFKSNKPEYITLEGNEHGKGSFEFALTHVGWAVASGFTVGSLRGFVPELMNPETRQLSGKPWMTRMVNATIKYGGGYARTAGAVVFIVSACEIIFKKLLKSFDRDSAA